MDANVEFCSVIKTKLGAHSILMGAEMDCCDSTNDGKRFYVELKTSREVDIVQALSCVIVNLTLLFLFSSCLLCCLDNMRL